MMLGHHLLADGRALPGVTSLPPYPLWFRVAGTASLALGTLMLLLSAAAVGQHFAASVSEIAMTERAAAVLPWTGNGIRFFWVAPAGCTAGILLLAALALEFNRRCGGAEILGVPQPEVLIVSGSRHNALNGVYRKADDGKSPGGLLCHRWEAEDGAEITQSAVRISIFGSHPRAARKRSDSGNSMAADDSKTRSRLTSTSGRKVICARHSHSFAMTMRAARGRWPHQFHVIPLSIAHFGDNAERMDWDEHVTIIAGDGAPASQHSGSTAYAEGICIVLALVCLIPCSTLPMRTYNGGFAQRSFAVPAGTSIPALAHTCRCIVVDGDVVLPPVALSCLTVAFSFAVNALYRFLASRVCTMHKDPRPINELMWESVRTPSWLFLLYSMAVQLAYLASLLWRCHSEANSLAEFVEKVLVNIMNSSVLVLFVTATAGQILTMVNEDEKKTGYTRSQPYAHVSLPAGLRQWIGYSLFVILSPGLALVAVASVRWFWISSFSSTLFAMMIEVLLPEASDAILQQRAIAYMALAKPSSVGERHTFLGRMEKLVKFGTNLAMFPMLNVVAYVSSRLGLWQRRTMVGPATRTLLVGMICFCKCLELQMFYDMAYFHGHSIGYLDSVPLAFQARQNVCSLCLTASEARRMWNTMNETSSVFMNETHAIADEAAAKFWSAFT